VTKSSLQILNSFEQKLKILEHIRKKQEILFSKGQIVRRDIEQVYAGVFLDAIVSFEALIEELFVGLLAGQVHLSRSKFNVRVKIQSHQVARDAVLRGRDYFNWLPYKNTRKIAEVFFTGGRPFTLLTKDEEKHIDKCLVVRHAFAHKSRHAVSKFEREVLGGLSLTPRDKRPKSFLRAQFSGNPPTNYYEQLVSELFSIASKLC